LKFGVDFFGESLQSLEGLVTERERERERERKRDVID